MVRLLVLFGLILAAAVAAPAAARADEPGCSSSAVVLGCVDAGVAGDAVTLVGQETTPGSAAGAVGGAIGTAAPLPRFTRNCGPDPSVCVTVLAAGIQPVTINDIATFRPTPGRQQMEPDGWTVAGLDTNFFAITDPHIVNGTLLGRPADVRFTPIAFHWTYGDGTGGTRNTKGGTWAALGIGEFDPTPTSHVYEQLGDYTITLSITFAAEYRFAGSAWRPVVGTITLPANDLHIRAGTAQTVLVEHTCTEDPGGPGC